MDEREQEVTRAMQELLDAGNARVTATWSDRPVRIHALEAGHGPPLLLLHGAGGGAANWFAVFDALSRNHHVIAPDLPGFGLSPAHPFEPPLGEAVAELLLEWLNERSIAPAHIVGTSLGGLIAIRMALANRAAVRSLVLIDAAGLGKELPVAVRLATLPGARGLAGSTSRTGLRLFFHRYLTSSPIPAKPRELLLEYIRACALAGGGDTLTANLSRFASVQGQREVAADDDLRSIAVPTLVIWGALDRFIPVAHGHRAAGMIPGARLVTIPAAGHSPNWEAPDRVTGAILDFTPAHAP
ncbi:MAG: alpha/beta fold hydrolase [Gemmatimonadetes bacterium]|nr:alpha/beta fold hydrolase [Gemmatimonadota bacterium]